MMKIIKDLLIKIINDIDTGNSNLSADECNKVIEYLTEITNKNEKELYWYKKDLDILQEKN